MPAKSKAQLRYVNAHPEKFDVDEWNESSRGRNLPERVKPKRRKRKK